ncbi:MAG: hypothetical protein ACM3XM_09450 [Mycobacterium leprae]
MEMDRLDILLGLVQTREWGRAWAEFQRLLNEGPQTPRLLYLGSLVAFGQGDLFRARHLADQALNGWTEADSTNVLGRIRFHLGMVARKIGDTHVAAEQFNLFLEELPTRYPELSMGEGKAYFYLALTLYQRRELDAAVQANRTAIDCFRRDGLSSHLAAALLDLAWLYCRMGRAKEARDSLSESANLVDTPELHLHQRLGEAYLAFVEEKFILAAELAQEIFQRAERGEPVTAGERSQAALLAARVALAQGNLGSAASLADIALSYGAEAKESGLVNDAAALRREVLLQQHATA